MTNRTDLQQNKKKKLKENFMNKEIKFTCDYFMISLHFFNVIVISVSNVHAKVNIANGTGISVHLSTLDTQLISRCHYGAL